MFGRLEAIRDISNLGSVTILQFRYLGELSPKEAVECSILAASGVFTMSWSLKNYRRMHSFFLHMSSRKVAPGGRGR